MSFKFNLRDKVKDTVTGFTGIVSSRTEWMNGCIRYGVQATKLTKEGKVADSEHLDEQQLVLVMAAAGPKGRPGGGPQRDQKSPFRS